ncbi:MAG: trypsin-like peptidase domain-containing protein [Candidatus Hydrogenedentes bacterium]|nr:trypsin-like peptidase domain-containing protein [Candidatus Hydrogenedentota bacterium]
MSVYAMEKTPWRMPRMGIALAAILMTLSGCVTTGGSQSAVYRARDKVAPALVHIRPVKEVYSRGKKEEVSIIGSGFIISTDGYVVTNEHVAGESKFVRCVLSNKEEVDAEVVGVDPFTDIAVLKLAVDYTLPTVKLGVSGTLEAGEMVMALGSPHGLARSVSLGIISVTDRYLESHSDMVSPYNTWIQTDAAINPGNSGGPLCNLRGEVIGVNARVLRGAENVGFAIPIDVVKEVSKQLIASGHVARSNVGISLQEMLAKTDDIHAQGVVIADVDPLSPASETDIRPGDILVKLNGAPVNARFEEDLPSVHKQIADLPVGQPATLTVQRGEEQLEITVTTEMKGALKGDEAEFTEWGFTASELTPELVRRAQLPSRQGVFVSGTQVGGLAGSAGLGQGDIILKIDDTVVENLAQFQEHYRKAVESQKKLTLLTVKNRALTRYIIVKQGPAAPGQDS